MKQLAIVIFVSVIFLPALAYGKTLPAGFSRDMIWFSKDPFFVGERIDVSTLIFNSTPYRMKGFVTLRDGTTTVDRRSFVLGGAGDSEVVSFPWIATPGTHSFFALIEQGEFVSSAPTSTASVIETSKVKRTASYDENKNGIPDENEPPIPKPRASATTSASSTLPEDPAKTAKDVIAEEAPKPIADLALPILGSVESFRIDEAKRASRNANDALSRIASDKGTTTGALAGDAKKDGWGVLAGGMFDGSVVRSPFDHVKLFFSLLARAVTSHPYVFYAILALILYKAARVLIGIFF